LDMKTVVIIGASQAGLRCAQLLARAGAEVEVFEHLRGPEEALPRTLIVTPELARFVPLGSDVPVRNTISGFRVRVDGSCSYVPLAQPDFVLERRDLLAWLAGEAERAGAGIHWGVRLLSVGLEDGEFALLFWDRRTGRYIKRMTSVLVAADGAVSTVLRSLECDGRATVPILQARVRRRQGFDPHVVDTWFAPGRTPYFFWQIPDSEETAAVGFVARDPSSGRREFARFLAESGWEVESVEAARVPLYRPFHRPYRRFGKARLYLVGDAAGHVKVTTVGGTVTGLAGAEAAARAILRGTSYSAELSSLRRELNAHYLVRLAMDRFTAGDYRRLLRCLNHRVLALLRDVPRDRFASVFWKTLLAQPALAFLGAKALLRAARDLPRRSSR